METTLQTLIRRGGTEAVGFDDNLWEWSHQVNRYFDEVGVDASVALERQVSLFARELIDQTPPKDTRKTAKKIEESIKAKFEALENPTRTEASMAGEQRTTKSGHGDIYWYAFSDRAIYGVGHDMDMRGASAKDLAEMLPNIIAKSKGGTRGRMQVGRRGRQTIYLLRKILTKSATRKELTSIVKGRIGILASGWVPSWMATGSAGRPLPKRVERHVDKSNRIGTYEDGLKQANPEFTLINRANGAPNIDDLLYAQVLNFRAHSMATDLARITEWRAQNPGRSLVLPGNIIVSPTFNANPDE